MIPLAQMNAKIKILFLDDMIEDIALAKRTLLKADLHFTPCDTLNEAEYRAQLVDFQPDIIISDFRMPGFDGLEALNIKLSITPYTPFIILTGSINEETATQCIKAGADDYVIKEHITRLPYAVIDALQRAQGQKEKRQALEALEENRQLLQSTLDSLRNLICVLDEKGFIIEANAAWREFSSTTTDSLIQYAPQLNYLNACEGIGLQGKQTARAFTLGVRDMMFGHLAELEFEYPCLNGSALYWFICKVSPIITGKKPPYKCVISFEDITSIKHTNEKLRESEKKYRELVESSLVGIYSISLHGKLTYANTALARLLEYESFEELQNISSFSIFEGEDTLHEITHTILNVKRLSSYGVNLRTKSGAIKSAILSAYLHNQIISGMIIDITPLKQAENELRTAKEAAEESNRVKSYFLGNISHELRTPLTAILGNTELLLDEELTDDLRERLESVLQAGQRLYRTLNIILNLTDVDMRKAHGMTSLASIQDVIQKLEAVYRPLAVKKNLPLIIHYPENFTFLTDTELLVEILSNLLDNAIKYTMQGEVKLEVEQREHSLVFTVTDTGIGIPTNKHDVIFEEFRQVSEGFSRQYEGTGLGLTVAKKFASVLDGTLTMQSEVGKGSVFCVTLPYNPVI